MQHLIERRRRLLGALKGRPAVIPAGKPIGRNYPGNPYPFRASSHFLYLVGRGLPGAALWLDGEATLYIPEPPPDDDLWHGPSEPPEALAEQIGCAVHYGDAPVSGDALILPAPDRSTCAKHARRLRRAIAPGRLCVEDEPLATAMIDLRLRHDAAAIAQLDEAAEATTAAHLAGMAATRPGVREWAICAAMEAALGARGMGTAYGSIVSVHGEVLHNHGHDNVVQAGDLLLADVGAETAEGWAGDVTRTWPVSGAFSDSQRALYEVVLASQLAAIEALRPGARYRDVHLESCRVLTEGLVDLGILKGDPKALVEEDVHATFFPHGVGHLIGLDVHDMEDLGDLAGYAEGRTRSERFGLGYLRLDRDLEPGMAVTIEPGFYQVPALLKRATDPRIDRARLRDFADVRGIRIEDDVLVTEGGRRVLSQAIPKDPRAVEEAVCAP